MKWYAIKTYAPSADGWYIVRWKNPDHGVGISYVLWDRKEWVDFNEDVDF